jgi:hypothetical protein
MFYASLKIKLNNKTIKKLKTLKEKKKKLKGWLEPHPHGLCRWFSHRQRPNPKAIFFFFLFGLVGVVEPPPRAMKVVRSPPYLPI